jgi:hypothetical protein
MKTFFRTGLALLAFTLITARPSLADPGHGADCAKHPDNPGCSSSVPEIDPALGLGALALLGGMVMVIRGRARQ